MCPIKLHYENMLSLKYYSLNRLVPVMLIALLGSCQDDEFPSSSFDLPNMFKIIGAATGASGELSIDCLCDLMVELNPEVTVDNGVKRYTGVHGGHFSREVLDATGAGIGIVPDVFGEIIVEQKPDGSIDFIFPANTNTGSRFWDSVGHFPGAIQDEEISGSWVCAPFDTREDTTGIITGIWQLVDF